MAEGLEHSKVDLGALRIEYRQRSLSEQEVDADPLRQFASWLNEAIAVRAYEPNAMTLATCTKAGVPSARMVLLKSVDRSGFAFFTNYQSRKGNELEENPQAALVFYWPELERQVRVEGPAQRTSSEESDEYFRSRPVESRMGSAASAQSEVIDSRTVLEDRVKQLWQKYPQGDVPRPPRWGGYRVRPMRMEFWQGRESRLHDRIEYVRDGRGEWLIRRLSP
ncbi:MAG: pyridoxamine 5'-phosphate oxidase [Bacillota bacterium]